MVCLKWFCITTLHRCSCSLTQQPVRAETINTLWSIVPLHCVYCSAVVLYCTVSRVWLNNLSFCLCNIILCNIVVLLGLVCQTESDATVVQQSSCCESTVSAWCVSVCSSVCVCMQGAWRQAAIPPWGSFLITQRSQPTPGHFLPDLPQESRACWAVDHTCWSQTILLPVPVWIGDTEREIERERHREGERERVLASICHLLCSLPPLSRSLSVSRSYSLASWLFTPAQPAQPQHWEQNTHWPSCSKLPPTLIRIKTWVIWAWIKFE